MPECCDVPEIGYWLTGRFRPKPDLLSLHSRLPTSLALVPVYRAVVKSRSAGRDRKRGGEYGIGSLRCPIFAAVVDIPAAERSLVAKIGLSPSAGKGTGPCFRPPSAREKTVCWPKNGPFPGRLRPVNADNAWAGEKTKACLPAPCREKCNSRRYTLTARNPIPLTKRTLHHETSTVPVQFSCHGRGVCDVRLRRRGRS